MIRKFLKIIIPFIFLFFSSNILAKVIDHYPILKGDVLSLSFENNQQLFDSIINVIKNFTDDKQVNKIKKTLSKKDNLNINPTNYSEIVSLLPLPSKTIIRIINNNFSEGLYNFLEYDLKKDIIISYGEIVNIEFEVIEIKPSNTKSILGKASLIKSTIGFPTKNNVDPMILAPLLAVPLVLSRGSSSSGSYNGVIENYSLVNENREQIINFIYKYNLNLNLNYVSAFNINKNYLGQENNNNLNLFQGLFFIF